MRLTGLSLRAVFIASLMTPLAAIPGPAAAQDSPGAQMQLSVGHGRLITLPRPMTDVFVADPGVADVQIRSTSQLYLFAKGAGETSVYATDRQGRVVFSTVVRVAANVGDISQMLSIALPSARITATPMGNMVLLTGEVAQPEDVAEAQRLVETMTGLKVLSRLQSATPQQVNLQVRIAEVSRSLVKNIGANLFGSDRNGFMFATGSNSGLDKNDKGKIDGNFVKSPEGSIFSRHGLKLLGLTLNAKLDLAEQQGLAVTLAQPNLTTLSGETADFLAGGEYPIPVPAGGNSNMITVDYKRYGVMLQYTPTVLSNGRISMRVKPEVSDITSDGAINVNGLSVPGLTVRRTETTVELGSGESFMIAGLLSNKSLGSVAKTPGFGDVPILGALFKSDGFRRGETELVIMITPYLVKPTDAANIKLPTDGYRDVGDLERVLLHQNSDGRNVERPMPTREGQAPAPVPPKRKSGASVAPGFNF